MINSTIIYAFIYKRVCEVSSWIILSGSIDLNLTILDGFVSSKIYDKRVDFDFDIVNFPFLNGDIPRVTYYGVYISHLILFARVSSHVADFITRNQIVTAKLLKQGYGDHKLRQTFSKFYRRHYDLVSKI